MTSFLTLRAESEKIRGLFNDWCHWWHPPQYRMAAWHPHRQGHILPMDPQLTGYVQSLSPTGWGPQSIAFSCLVSGWVLWFMVDVTVVNGGYFMVYKPTYNWGAPSPSITYIPCWLVVYLPLWTIWKSVGMMTFRIYGTKKDSNHQPDELTRFLVFHNEWNCCFRGVAQYVEVLKPCKNTGESLKSKFCLQPTQWQELLGPMETGKHHRWRRELTPLVAIGSRFCRVNPWTSTGLDEITATGAGL